MRTRATLGDGLVTREARGQRWRWMPRSGPHSWRRCVGGARRDGGLGRESERCRRVVRARTLRRLAPAQDRCRDRRHLVRSCACGVFYRPASLRVAIPVLAQTSFSVEATRPIRYFASDSIGISGVRLRHVSRSASARVPCTDSPMMEGQFRRAGVTRTQERR